MIDTQSMKNPGTFRYVINHGIFYKGKYTTIYAYNNKIGKNILGICISKKNGKSVVRNKLKRWAREIYKEEEEKLKIGIHFVILYKKKDFGQDINYWDLKQEIQIGFSKLNMYEKNN